MDKHVHGVMNTTTQSTHTIATASLLNHKHNTIAAAAAAAPVRGIFQLLHNIARVMSLWREHLSRLQPQGRVDHARLDHGHDAIKRIEIAPRRAFTSHGEINRAEAPEIVLSIASRPHREGFCEELRCEVARGVKTWLS
jgi:hypothetical protein